MYKRQELKNNIKSAWRKKFIQECKYNVGLDSAILMNPQTWVASGHIGGFSDPLMDCKACKTRHRADNLIEDFDGTNCAGWSNEQMMDYIREKGITCPNCGKADFTDIRQFNLMFKTFQGVTEDSKSELYLRPETAQGIFVNFMNIQRTTRKKVPFGVAQVGKSFRNEITPGNFIFRVREFEQMELEFFCKPGTDLDWFYFWKDYCKKWLLSLGINEENLRPVSYTHLAGDLETVSVNDGAEIVQLIVTAGHGAFPDASFGKLTIAHDNIYAVIALVHLTGECHTDRDRQTVAERTGVHLDTIDFIVGVTDVLGEILGNRFQILAGEESFLAENRVKCLNRMTFTEDKAVMIGIMKILGSKMCIRDRPISVEEDISASESKLKYITYFPSSYKLNVPSSLSVI